MNLFWSLVNEQLVKLESCIGAQIDAENKKGFDAFVASRALRTEATNGQPRSPIMTYSGSVATIFVQGVLTQSFDLWAWFFYGNTTYIEIIQAIEEAEANEDIERVDFDFDSGGGSVLGMFDAMDAIANMTKPTRGLVATMACSACYGLASQTSEIVATGRGAMFGSVGVVSTHYVSDDVIEITSSNAENKRPDPRTDEGRAAIIVELDEIETMFIDSIAEGRDTTGDGVRRNFGRGAVMLADRAKANGLIDTVGLETPQSETVNNEVGATMSEMTLAKLKADYPALMAEAHAESHAAGVTAERTRVNGHLELADASGDTKYALECIKDGSEADATCSTKHTASAIAAVRAGNLEQDSADADAGKPAGGGAQSDADAQAKADEEVAAMMRGDL